MGGIQQDQDCPVLTLNIKGCVARNGISLSELREVPGRHPAKKQGPQSCGDKELNFAAIM
jgi:hypothetical protein